MGKKYIIEIGRLERLYKAFVSAHGKPEITWLSPEVDLTPYTEPDLEQVRMEAYEKGRKDVETQFCSYDACKNRQKEYQRGLADAWEAARKIQDTGGNLNWWIHNTSASEAAEKARQYEQSQEKIKVGDEVSLKGGSKGFVTRILMLSDEQKSAYVVWSDGYVGNYSFDVLQKTGKHYSDVVEVLQKMKEGE